jgi:magnesium-transporting ATPase (P-type)
MWFALFDFQFSKDEFLKNPQYYKIGLKSKCFGTAIFWRWIGYGAYQAFLILFICYVPFDNSVNKNGQTGDLWTSGAIAYAAVVIIANLKLFDCFNSHVIWGDLLILASILSYFLIYYIENEILALNYLFGTF